MIFINTLEKVDDFIISKINFEDNRIELNWNYYLLIDNGAVVGDSENYDFKALNYEEFLSQPDIDFIVHKYEVFLISEIEHYQQDFITTFANNFSNCNTELSQRMYYENTIKTVKNCISRFVELLSDETIFANSLNNIQSFTLSTFNDVHSTIVRILNEKFDKYINPVIKIEHFKTIFGLDLHFIEKLYKEFQSYELFSKPISQSVFLEILNIDYKGETKIELKFNSLTHFYYLVSYFKDNFSSKHMLFYEQVSKRFLVSTAEKSNISFNAKKLSNGISDLNKGIASRVVKNGSEILNIVNNLKL